MSAKPKTKVKPAQDLPELEGPSKLAQDINHLQLLEKQIRILNEQHAAAVEKAAKTAAERDHLVGMLKATTTEKEEIVEFLNLKIRDYETKLSALDHQLRAFESGREAHEAELTHRTEKRIAELTEALENAQRDHQTVEKELASVETFRLQRNRFDEQLENAKQQLDIKDKQYKESLTSVERLLMQEKAQMRKDLFQKVNDALTNLRKVAKQQMDETTVRVLQENMALSSQIKKMSRRTLGILRENEQYKSQIRQYKLDLSLAQETSTSALRQKRVNESAIHSLIGKLKVTDAIIDTLASSQGSAALADADANDKGPSLAHASHPGAQAVHRAHPETSGAREGDERPRSRGRRSHSQGAIHHVEFADTVTSSASESARPSSHQGRQERQLIRDLSHRLDGIHDLIDSFTDLYNALPNRGTVHDPSRGIQLQLPQFKSEMKRLVLKLRDVSLDINEDTTPSMEDVFFDYDDGGHDGEDDVDYEFRFSSDGSSFQIDDLEDEAYPATSSRGSAAPPSNRSTRSAASGPKRPGSQPAPHDHALLKSLDDTPRNGAGDLSAATQTYGGEIDSAVIAQRADDRPWGRSAVTLPKRGAGLYLPVLTQETVMKAVAKTGL